MALRIKFILLVSLLGLAAGCTRMDPNPEIMDPIYQSFVKEQRNYEKLVEEGEKALATAKAELELGEVRTLDKKIQQSTYNKAVRALQQAKEMATYYKVRADLRKAYGRKEYKIAFQKGEKWPNPSEVYTYQLNKELRDAPRNWSARVPKSQHQALTENSGAKLKSPGEEAKGEE